MYCTRLAENTGRKKIAKKSPSRHHRTTLSGCICTTKACINNRKLKQQYRLHISSQYGELRPPNGWDLFRSLGHPCKFQRVSRLCSVTARHSSSGRQPNFAALNRGRHLYSTGRPSRWALAHILFLTWNHVWNEIKLFYRLKQFYLISAVVQCWSKIILKNFIPDPPSLVTHAKTFYFISHVVLC